MFDKPEPDVAVEPVASNRQRCRGGSGIIKVLNLLLSVRDVDATCFKTPNDIAVDTGLPVNTVKSHLRNLRRPAFGSWPVLMVKSYGKAYYRIAQKGGAA